MPPEENNNLNKKKNDEGVNNPNPDNIINQETEEQKKKKQEKKNDNTDALDQDDLLNANNKKEEKKNEQQPFENDNGGDLLINQEEPPKNQNNIILDGIQEEEQRKQDENKAENARVFVFTQKLKAYREMYGINIDADKFASSISDAWEKINSDKEETVKEGKKILADTFSGALKQAFDYEKDVAYKEHRLPEYPEIVKSTNELTRSAMYAFTDLYHNQNKAKFFEETAFGGLDVTELSKLSKGKSLFSMNQRSDEAWEIQSEQAKAIAKEWMKEKRPHEKMISELNAMMADVKRKSSYNYRDAVLKFAAAEWFLLNDDKMMIEDPEDPYNPIPDWGNRYWSTLTKARDMHGFNRHTSIREMLQSNYDTVSKAVKSTAFCEKQIKEHVLDKEPREKCDSLERQKEQFATLSASYTFNKVDTKENVNDGDKKENEIRTRLEMEHLNERKIMKSLPTQYNFTIENDISLTINATKQSPNSQIN